LEIKVEYGQINLFRPTWNKVAYTEYDEELYEKIKSFCWSKSNDYLYSSGAKDYLHRFVMKHWYGEKTVKDATNKGFVVDHLDNNGFNCKISNLHFLYNNVNKAKGLTYDRDRASYSDMAALHIFKDFKTKQYQITIGFNQPTEYIKNDRKISIVDVKLLYSDDFLIVLNDAAEIIHKLEKYGRFEITKLNYIDGSYTEAIFINPSELTPEEIQVGYFIRNEEMFVLQGGKIKLHKVEQDKNLYKDE
jgi:hypothetical protein